MRLRRLLSRLWRKVLGLALNALLGPAAPPDPTYRPEWLRPRPRGAEMEVMS